ncbi:hypothetical protein ACFWB5_12675, partial [Corynebacterium xerosis]|uniref:hypothetical protein n=1 Tax=Corynebacterium xerosis TaxID=1725 RepID=UPI0036660055
MLDLNDLHVAILLKLLLQPLPHRCGLVEVVASVMLPEGEHGLGHALISVIEQTHESVWVGQNNKPEVPMATDARRQVLRLRDYAQTKARTVLQLMPVALDGCGDVAVPCLIGEEEVGLPYSANARAELAFGPFPSGRHLHPRAVEVEWSPPTVWEQDGLGVGVLNDGVQEPQVLGTLEAEQQRGWRGHGVELLRRTEHR